MPIAVEGLERLAGDMLDIYAQAEERMLQRLSKYLGKDLRSDSWIVKKYNEIHAVRQDLQKIIADLKAERSVMTEEFVKKAWNTASEAFVAEAHKFTDQFGVTPLSPNSPKVTSIIADMNNALNAEDRFILRAANDIYADVIGESSALVATGTYTIREAVAHALNDFADKGISGFVDKSGRTWDMATYAEMATITAIQKATMYGYVDTMKEYGHDLAIISSHTGACPLCEAWQDVIVSVSGDNKNYPSLDEAIASGCFHPRCVHDLSTYFEGVTREGRDHPSPVKEPNAAYTNRQRQRYLERRVRQWKRRMAVSTSALAERIAYAHVRQYQKMIRDQIKQYHPKNDRLERKYYREGGNQKLSPEARKLKPVALH